MGNSIEKIIVAFGFQVENVNYSPIGNGLINATFLLQEKVEFKDYILQEINRHVFKEPHKIAKNIRITANYLTKHFPDYLFPSPIQTVDGKEMACINNSYWRLIPYIENSIVFDEVDSVEIAYQAAKTFAGFTKRLNDCPLDDIQHTIPNFHNLSLRVEQFEKAIQAAQRDRLNHAESLIQKLKHYLFIEDIYKEWTTSPEFKQRLQHHDTKISNVLLHQSSNQGLCVIDLDTLMTGYIFSDFGDMVRTYLSPVSENETDLDKIIVRKEYFEAIQKGYLEEKGEVMTPKEKESLFNAGLIMIYMQSLRFLTDYLNRDAYYRVNYPLHNYDRAMNQFILLHRYMKLQ